MSKRVIYPVPKTDPSSILQSIAIEWLAMAGQTHLWRIACRRGRGFTVLPNSYNPHLTLSYLYANFMETLQADRSRVSNVRSNGNILTLTVRDKDPREAFLFVVRCALATKILLSTEPQAAKYFDDQDGANLIPEAHRAVVTLECPLARAQVTDFAHDRGTDALVNALS